MALGFSVNPDKTKLTALNTTESPKSKAPCHLAVDHTGHTLVVVNYQTGDVASFPIRADGSLGAVASLFRHSGSSINPERQASAHAHSATISPDNKYVFVCDLGLDKVFAYKLDVEHSTIAPAEPPFVTTAPGSGPRHFAFAPNGRHAFMVTEMGGTLTAYAYTPNGGLLVARDTQSTLPPDFHESNTSAAIRVHPNGKFVYASNRGPDTIAVFAFDETNERLKMVQTIASGGKGPRDFALSPDGRWLIAAHQYSNSLTVFKVDPATGQLTPTSHTATIPTPVCVLFVNR
jgi:6-phosphogluconolactonase